MKFKKILAIFIILTLVSSLIGCGQSKSSETADLDDGAMEIAVEYQDTIIIAPALGFTGQDVQKSTSGTGKSVFSSVFNTLVDLGLEGEIVPELAESWELKADTIYEFKLRKDVVFHDGKKFDAKDVKFTIEHGLEESASSGKMKGIDEVKIIDDYTVQFILDAPNMDLLYKLTDRNCCMLSSEAFASLDDEEAYKIGTGPYKYEEWVEGDYVSFVRFDNYWGERPNTNKIIVKTIPEASSRLIALQTGEVDVIIDPPPVDLHYIAEDPDLHLKQVISAAIRYIGLNTRDPILENPLVRKAMAYGINRDDYITAVYEGNAIPHNNVVHASTEFYSEIKGYNYDPDKAKALLAEAGYPDGFSITVKSSSGTIEKNCCPVFQAQMADIGIKVNIENYETATYVSMRNARDIQAIVDSWGGHFIGPDNALRSHWYAPDLDRGSNITGIADPYVNETLDAALAEGDINKRKQLYAELQRYLVEDLATELPICIEFINIGLKKNIDGWRDPDGIIYDWSYICIPK